MDLDRDGCDTRQIIAFHVGDRSRHSGKELWAHLPLVYREQATFHTDHYQGDRILSCSGEHPQEIVFVETT